MDEPRPDALAHDLKDRCAELWRKRPKSCWRGLRDEISRRNRPDFESRLSAVHRRSQGSHCWCPHREAESVNHDGILLYWDIGRGIVEKQELLGWGDAVVETVAADLRRAFPGSKSFSADNVWRMRQFYLAYSAPEFLGQAVPEIASAGVRSDQLAIQH